MNATDHITRLCSSPPDRVVVGIDEVGRGPLAGPVVACACLLPDALRSTPEYAQINDSKKLTAKKRERLAVWLRENAIYAIGEASVTEIDAHNILQATFIAMGRAYDALPASSYTIKVDGNYTPHTLPQPCEAVIGGDGLVPEIAAASILAKVYRDDLMTRLAQDYTVYGWDKNAGYGTAAHMEGLRVHGVTPHHRLSFAPVAAVVQK